MFNSMKNQFREKTGRELPKFTPQKGGLSRQSRQGSESSICSLVQDQAPQKPPSPLPPTTATPSPSSQDSGPAQLKLADGKVLSNKDINLLAKKEEEWRSRMEKKEAEWAKKIEKLESDLKHSLALKEEDWRKREQELTEDLLKQTNELMDSLKTAEDYKRKLIQFQEEKDSIEGFQTQEMAKIKHLLLAKEKECNETSGALKELAATVDTLNAELVRLRPLEEQVTNCQVGRLSRQAGEEGAERRLAETKVTELQGKLDEEIEERKRLASRVTALTQECDTLASELKSANVLAGKLREQLEIEERLSEIVVLDEDIIKKRLSKK